MDDTIDRESFRRQIDYAFQVGAHGYCTGMVSELLRLTTSERIELTELLGECNSGRGVVVAGVGAESTRQAIEFAKVAERSGCHAIMAIPPISKALPEPQLLSYFCELAECVDLALIVQDASSYVGQALPMSLYIELLKRYGPDKILFKPEAAPIGPNLSALRDATGGQAKVFEGSGGICLVDSYRRGITGTMPGMEFLPGIVGLWRALEQQDEARIYALYFPICALVALQLQAGLDGFLATEKYIMHKLGVFATDRRRRPYTWDMDEETRLEIDRLMELLRAVT
jgi:4-hydroxy-tetrahydrodipicolinate synthase